MITRQLRERIIRPTLEKIDLWSPEAEQLILGTCAVESNMGEYLVQINGPARGIFQMEPATEQDIWEHWLLYRPHLTQRLCTFGIVLEPTDESIIYNLAYATAMARFHYARVPEKLPHHEDVDGLAKYWKSHYNTHLGKGTVGKFVELYHKFDIGGVTWEE